MAHNRGDKQGEANSLVTRAFIAFREGDYEAALEHAFAASGVLEAMPLSVWRLRLYNILGMIHFELGERAAGYDYLEQQRTLSQHLGDREMEALAQHDIAVFYLAGEAKRQALENTLKVFETLKSRLYKGIALYNLSNYHLSVQAHAESLLYAEQALRTFSAETFVDLHVMILGVQAESYGALQRKDPAVAAIQRALALADAHAPQLRGYCYARLGVLYNTLAAKLEALAAFELSLEYATGNASYLLDVHGLLAESYAEMGDYARAYAHQTAYQRLHNEIFKAEGEQKVRALEVVYRTRNAQREAELERARNAELRSHIAQLEALNAHIRELSIRDSLTGLYNRRHFGEQLAQHFAFVAEEGRSLGLILLDIDHFKEINDAFGHAAGDAVLAGVARLLLIEVRETDIVSRYGGEEFAILLPQQDLARTLTVAERIRTRVETEPWRALTGSRTVTLSLGVAMSASCLDTDELLRRADAHLYEAKRRGRNRLYSPSTT